VISPDTAGSRAPKKSRILFLVSSMEGGGAERVAALLSNHWAERGYDVTLMPTFSGRGECIYPLDKQVKLVYLADRVADTSKSLINKLRRLFVLRGVISELDPDVIVSFLPHVNAAAIMAAMGLQIRIVVAERTYPPAMPLSPVLERVRAMAYPRAFAVVMQTEQGMRWLSSTCANKAQGRVIPNPVVYPLPIGEPMVQPAYFIEPARKILLAVGRLGEEKGFDILMRAFAKIYICHPDWDLVILGEGVERQRLEAQRDALNLGDRVQMPGRVGNLADWYNRADLYVLSSRFEGFPNTLAEAMAHGLPAVSFDCDTGPRDIIRHDIDGFLVSPDAGAEGLAQALSALMANPAKRKCMAEAATAVRERFSMSYVSGLWDEVLGLEPNREIG
jgi:GalNAc-alpha-(1->4)-GalNAc-alpha-(1->3)-diNAcBac-PP-undecaprenol alpha-1,4-N-acetyl-D-galactosaminyltransferase